MKSGNSATPRTRMFRLKSAVRLPMATCGPGLRLIPIPSWSCHSHSARGERRLPSDLWDLASRLANRVQLTTDGHRVYLQAVEDAFGSAIDYAMLIKLYGNDSEPEKRYSPAECIGCREIGVMGQPDPKHISTSHVERQNLTMRMGMRRFTRLTNGFSKKVDNHFWAIALHYVHYNFCRVRQTLRVTPAMEAGIADHAWSIEEIE